MMVKSALIKILQLYEEAIIGVWGEAQQTVFFQKQNCPICFKSKENGQKGIYTVQGDFKIYTCKQTSFYIEYLENSSLVNEQQRLKSDWPIKC